MSATSLNHAAAQTLYEQLQSFRFDTEGTALSFLDRLADENAWSQEYAGAVLEEYRRFLVLAMHAGHPVTPSDAVDQVWHLHLVYSDSYWNKLCAEVLGKPLHHYPTQGGEQEHEKYLEQYQRTLDSYQQIFAEEPPETIWPTPEERFAQHVHFQRVDVNQSTDSIAARTSDVIHWGKLAVVGLVLLGVGSYANWIYGFFAAFFVFAMLSGSGSASADAGGGGCGTGGGCGGGCGG